MPTPTCAKCRRVIPGDDINVAKDVAYCRECNISYQLSALTYGGDDIGANLDLNHPPKGAWYISNGGSTITGATNRNLASAFGLLFFALFWNGIVSIFVALAIAGTLHNFHVSPPAWFPAPKMNGGDMSVRMTIFLWLFLTPFITIGLWVAGGCLSSLFGRTEARIENTRVTLFTGIGALGWKRKFDASQVKEVRIYQERNNKGADTFGILIETREGKQLKLGSMLTNERRQFVLGALRRTLVR